MTPRKLLPVLVALVLSSCTAPEPGGDTSAPVLGEAVQTGNTNFWWYYGQTPSQVSSLVATHNARLVSLRVESASPLLFDVALVQNSGTYAKTWWWYYGQTAQELQDQATAHDARIVGIEPYVVNGTTYFAAIMLHNVGADYSGWWWYYGQSPSQISSLLSQHNARLVDLRQYGNGSYAVVMVPNTGAESSGWWWYYNVTPAQISSLVTQNHAYLISLDPANASGSAFNVIMNQQPSPTIGWWWYYGQTEAQVNSLWQANKARIFDIKSYVVNGTRYFAVLMLANTWSSTQASEASCDASLVAGWNASPPAVGLGSSSATSSYDAIITGLMKKYGVPGGAVAVMNHGKLVLARGYGFADQGNAELAHPDSLFRIASLSKQITSAAILKLVDQGKLSLSTKAFPLLGFTANPSGTQTSGLANITIEELLQHTGGWSRETGCTGCLSTGDPMFDSIGIKNAQGDAGPPSCDQIIQYMLTQPLKWTPGTTYDYSNFGYCVLGAVVEKVTGQSYPSWVAANLFAPAGAGGIVQGQTIWPADREVVYYDYPGHATSSDVFAPSDLAFGNPYGSWYLEAMMSHGAWVASPVDLLRFQGALDGRTGVPALLSSTSLTDLAANPNVLVEAINSSNQIVAQTGSSTSWYGMGWAVNSGGNWWHFGDLDGTVAEQVHAANGWGWAAFFNERPSNSSGFENELDQDLWNAFNGTTTWLTTNLFDQYGAYTGWTDGATYQSWFNSEVAAGRYPSRVEGTQDTGRPLYRAAFVPFHGSAFQSRNGIDCPTYQSLASSYASQGYQTASLQSFVSDDGTRRYQATWVKW